MANHYLNSSIKQFRYYKDLGEKTIAQLSDDQLFWQYNGQSNSIAALVKHLSGNMLSRWTDFLNSDGEKEWRERDAEFENDIRDKEEIFLRWNKGWDCLFDALNSITDDDLSKTIYIRNEPHTVLDAIHRQLAHYPYHIGQIVYIGKMLCDSSWKSLSIPLGGSKAYNSQKFSGNKN